MDARDHPEWRGLSPHQYTMSTPPCNHHDSPRSLQIQGPLTRRQNISREKNLYCNVYPDGFLSLRQATGQEEEKAAAAIAAYMEAKLEEQSIRKQALVL